MRLEGQSKLGFYATPPRQVALIKTWLSGQNTRLPNPCCGKGEALAEIAATSSRWSPGQHSDFVPVFFQEGTYLGWRQSWRPDIVPEG